MACQFDYLCELNTDKAIRRALHSLPPTLFATYERILDKVNASNEDTQHLVQRVLTWIICSKKPLSTKQLLEAVSLEEGQTKLDTDAMPDEEGILKWCSSLVRRTPDGQTLELAHFTVEEFLAAIDCGQTRNLYGRYKITSASQDLTLANLCLTYLEFENFQGDNWKEKKELLEFFKDYPFFEYAAKYWNVHAENHQDDKNFLQLAKILFDPSKSHNFLYWVQHSRWNLIGPWANPSYSPGPPPPPPPPSMHSGPPPPPPPGQPFRNGPPPPQLSRRSPLTGVDDPSHDSIELISNAETLHFACSLSLWPICDWLLKEKHRIVDLNKMSNFGTPIYCVLSGPEFNPFRSAPEAGWRFTRARTETIPAWVVSAQGRASKALKHLLDADIAINNVRVHPRCDWTPLTLALRLNLGWIDLLERGALVDETCLDALKALLKTENEIYGGIAKSFISKVGDLNLPVDKSRSVLLHTYNGQFLS